jgi:hypothetical protein
MDHECPTVGSAEFIEPQLIEAGLSVHYPNRCVAWPNTAVRLTASSTEGNQDHA